MSLKKHHERAKPMTKGGDMIVRLYELPDESPRNDVKIKRAFPGDKRAILRFIEENFSKSWADEAEHALMLSPPGCFLAVEEGKIVGFACYDATAKGFFGPTGVSADLRGRGIGRDLLLRCLHAMREAGYAYAVIGWVSDAEQFYRKTVGAEFIPGGTPENSEYANMISL